MKKIMLCWLMAICSFSLWAQPGPPKGQQRFDPQKFQQMVEESLTKAAGLSSEEAKAFFPLYNEMRQKQREMGIQIHELKKNATGDAKAYTATILKIKQLQVNMAELEQNYYKRFMKVIPPEKVFQVMKAEDDFHRRMVQRQRGNQNDRHPDGRKRDGHQRRPQQ